MKPDRLFYYMFFCPLFWTWPYTTFISIPIILNLLTNKNIALIEHGHQASKIKWSTIVFMFDLTSFHNRCPLLSLSNLSLWKQRRHHPFPCEMTSDKWLQKFDNDDASLPDLGSASDWTEQISNQSEALSNLGSDMSSEWNFCAHFSDVITQGNQRWRLEMSAVFIAV